MLERSSDYWSTQEWIERAVISQYDRLETQKVEARARALAVPRGLSRDPDSAVKCVLSSQAGHNVATCW